MGWGQCVLNNPNILAEFMESFITPDYVEDLLRVQSSNAEPCGWILKRPTVDRWLSCDDACLLHVYGKPGCTDPPVL